MICLVKGTPVKRALLWSSKLGDEGRKAINNTMIRFQSFIYSRPLDCELYKCFSVPHPLSVTEWL
jgi:hypothetical protein